MGKKHIIYYYQKLMILCFVSLLITAVALTSLNYYIKDSKENLVSKSLFQENSLNAIINESEYMFGTAASLMNQFFNNNLEEIIHFFVEKKQSSDEKYNLIQDLYSTQSNFLKDGISISLLDLDTRNFYTPVGIKTIEEVLLSNNFNDYAFDKISKFKYNSDPIYLVSSTNNLLILKPWSNSSLNNKVIECYLFDLSQIKLPTNKFNRCSFWVSANSKSIFKLLASNANNDLASTLNEETLNTKKISSMYFDLEYYISYPKTYPIFQNNNFTRIIMPSLIVLISIGLIYLLFTILYKPIKGLYSNCLDINENKKDKTNEIELFTSTLTDMRGTIEELQERESSNSILIRKKKIKDLLLGISNFNELDNISSDLKLPVSKGKGSILIIDCNENNRNDIFENVKISEQIYTLLENKLYKLSTPGNDAVIQLISLNRICLLTSKNNKEELSSIAKSYKNLIGKNLKEEVVLAICCIQKNETIPIAYNRVINITNANHQKFNIVVEGKPKNNNVSELIYNIDTEKELIDILIKGNSKKIEALTLHIINQNLASNVPKHRISQALYITALRVMQDSNLKNNYSSDFKFNENISNKQFCDNCVSALLKISAQILEKLQEETKDFSSMVIKYIDENYDKDISLTDVAEHFHFSMVYMSSLFKKTIGVNFKEHINNLRVEKAQELLKTDNKVREVATMVGFNSTDSFIRMFKRITGTSPGKFKRDNLIRIENE